MFGLDESIAELGAGGSLAPTVAVATLLGLRHATDPDHLTAVSTLVASDDEHGAGAGRGCLRCARAVEELEVSGDLRVLRCLAPDPLLIG